MSTLEFSALLFVILLPCCAFFSYKRGFIVGADLLIHELANRNYLTPEAKKLFGLDQPGPFDDND